jgi:hypothetical protein
LLQHSFRPYRVAVLPALVVAVFLSLVGCGKKTPSGEVSGHVTFKGQPVSEGRVTFESQQSGIADEALLNNDGAYAIKKPLPVGDYQVYVIPLIVREKADPKGPVVGVEKPALNIPDKYRRISTTDLKATVKEGKNEHNFDMKP